MKAIGYLKSLPIDHPESLMDLDITQPIAIGRDLLVKVKAIAVNPADYKVRMNSAPVAGEHKILGWDAVGEVVATGEAATAFTPGDLVYYAGDITRQGSNAQYQLVDERIVGMKPKSLSDGEAAALPLTAITAWELLFEHLNIKQQAINKTDKSDEVMLVVGAAGGVGSILLQLANTLTGATVIATASRERSQAWVKKLGADFVIDHNQPLQPQIETLGIGPVTHVASLNSTDTYFDTYTELLAPFGKIAIIDDPKALDVTQLKRKSLSLHWEFMFARSMFNAVDLQAQSQLLNRVSDLVDQGYIQTTLGQHLGQINAKNLRAAHEALAAGKAIGKVVLEGF
ncbi:zinc-binding alcohol dehydrogenase family protein [Shewanella surugensis]|uniref:Zinc-type alcohol dehydrogenase-like protein n=1 Tax=Shewanella surugensis TaxID=212020 RepID=A0ABT0LBN9_9GAMM|nr:zinc-binding alcohol dehydrogenase family protein [Shewanella surugensis]MCL1125116.1 zinc-binding alcohol dehydrogenase family protein [Shewanella surugensis]